MKPIQHGARSKHGTLMGKELYRTEDDSGSIIVTQRGNKRLLSFGSNLEQSSVLMAKPYYLIHEYTQVMLLGLLFVDARHITLLGLGGGGLVHCLSHYYPQSTIRVVEIRQAVIDIAYDWFDLPRLDTLQVVKDDAIHYIKTQTLGSSDIIFSDLYEAEGMSAQQAHSSFIETSYKVLSENGCLVLNFHDKPDGDSSLMGLIAGLFREVIVYDSDQFSGDSSGKRNSIMFCCKRTVTLHQSDTNWSAECLVKRVKMPLMIYYRNLRALSLRASII